MRHKVAIRFTIEGDLRYISHHDTMRLFERALARARIPVRFSEGFNPRPRISLPVPRTVGVGSEADLLIVDLTEPVDPSDLLERLGPQMPAGLRLTEAWKLDTRTPPQPEEVEYVVQVPPDREAEISAAVNQLMACTSRIIQRASLAGKPARTVDLRVFLVRAKVEAGLLRWAVRAGNEGSVRPGEILAAVGLDEQLLLHRVRRTEIVWQTEPAFPKRAAQNNERPQA